MKQLTLLVITTLLLATVFTTGCIRFPGSDEPETGNMTIPTADAIVPLGTYEVKVETSKGDFIIKVHRDWSPLGAERFYQLVKEGYYDECRFFRVLPGFMVQWGISGDPAANEKWRKKEIRDDPPKRSNKRGYVTFAKSSEPNSRTTQVFINYGDNAWLDAQGFTPFGEVIRGSDRIDQIESKYEQTPDQQEIQEKGNAYLNSKFPDLDYIIKATIIKETKPEAEKPEPEKPEETKPEETKPEETKPEETKPETEKPKTEKTEKSS